MKKINIIGSFFGMDGYSNHTRQFANALDKLDDVEVAITTNRPQNWELQCNDRELEMIKRKAEDCDTNLVISTPPNWKYYMCENKDFIGFLVWEGSSIPKGWLNVLKDKRVKQIWVPSNHVKKAIENTTSDKKILDKIKIVPEGVDTKLFYVKKRDKNLPFTFFVNKGFRDLLDRGGTQYTIKAYLEEFSKDDDVELLIKINSSYGIPNIQKIIDMLKPKTNKEFPIIKVSTENYNYNKMVDLYNLGDIFVAPSRAEGFHLGCIEALACGLPVITTNFGGQTDFVPNDNIVGFHISGKLEEVKHDVMYEGNQWLVPNINELRKTMRYCYDNKDKIRNENTKKQCIDIANKFSWDNAAKIAHKHLLE